MQFVLSFFGDSLKRSIKQLRILQVTILVFILGVYLALLIYLYQFTNSIPDLMVNSYANLRRKDNMLNVVYLMPYLIYRKEQTSNSTKGWGDKDSVFGVYTQPVLNPKLVNTRAVNIEKIFTAYQKSTFRDKLVSPQYNELQPNAQIEDIRFLDFILPSSHHIDPFKLNLYDSFVQLYYLLNHPTLTPTRFKLYRTISFKIYEELDSFLYKDTHFENLVSIISNLTKASIALVVFIVLLVFLLLVKIFMNYRLLRKGFTVSLFIEYKKEEIKILKRCVKERQLKVKIDFDAVIQKEVFFVDKKNIRITCKEVFGFMIPLAIFALISCMMVFGVTFYFIIYNRASIVNVGAVVTNVVDFDFVLCHAIITLQNPLSKPLIDGPQFKARMSDAYTGVFQNPVLGPLIMDFFDLDSSLCSELATRKFIDCESVMNGILTQGYRATFHFLVNIISSKLNSNKQGWFNELDHEEVYRLIFAFIYANRILRDKFKFANQQSVIELQQNITIAIWSGIFVLFAFFAMFFWNVEKQLVKKWTELLSLLHHLRYNCLETNSYLRKFLKGDLL